MASKHSVGFLFVLSCLSKQIIEAWIKCGRCASPALDAASQGPQATGWVQQLRHAARGACNYPPASLVALCTHHVPPPIPCCEGWHRGGLCDVMAREETGGWRGGRWRWGIRVCGGSQVAKALILLSPLISGRHSALKLILAATLCAAHFHLAKNAGESP